MQNKNHPSISLIKLLTICSFASFGAVLPMPALSLIGEYFVLSSGTTSFIMSIYLIGYAIGQLLYGPLSNRFGRKHALLCGIGLAIVGAILEIIATQLHSFSLFLAGRFILALGAAAGLVISMILIRDIHDGINARRSFAKVVLTFAFVPFIATALAGSLIHYINWKAINGVMVVYAITLLIMLKNLPETLPVGQRHIISPRHLLHAYQKLFKNHEYMSLILLFSLSGSTSYLFNALAPIITIKEMHITPVLYGWLSFIPSIGMLLGGWLSNHLAHRVNAIRMIEYGIGALLTGSLGLAIVYALGWMNIFSLYVAAIIFFFGTALITPNASMQALAQIEDHANGASVMNATVLVISSVLVNIAGKFIALSSLTLPVALIGIGIVGIILLSLIKKKQEICSSAA